MNFQDMPPEQRRRCGKKGGSASKHVLRFTLGDLMEVTGRSGSAIRKDRQRKKLDFQDLSSVVRYCVKHTKER